MYSFLRGFGETDYNQIENLKNELREEIGAHILSVSEMIGRIIPDSGLSASGACVYIADIASYKFDSKIHEGISEIIEVSAEQLENMINDRKIDDAFTLEAYAMYKNYIIRTVGALYSKF